MSLSVFEGTEVQTATIAVTNAGDGLSESLKVEPREFHLGDEVYVVLRTEVAKVRHEQILDKGEPTGTLKRVHVLKSSTATIVDPGLVADVIADQEDRNRKAKEEAAGVTRLPLDGDDGLDLDRESE